MELKQLWAVITRRWWLILIPAIVALLLAIPSLLAMVRPPVTYTVTLRFTASQVPQPDKTQSFQDQSYIPWLASEYIVNNLAVWMRTESFAHAISNRLQEQGTPVDVGAVQGAIQTDSARSIMTLEVKYPDPDMVRQIALSAIEVLREQNQVYFPQLGSQRAEVGTLDAVNVVQVAPPLTTRLGGLFRVLIGLIIGLALAFLAEYLDPAIRDRRDLELLGLPVLGEIPRGTL
jgi:capsular polysaccharide biosynthesis protein